MIRLVSPNPKAYKKAYAKAGTSCYRGLLIKEDTGATPVGGGHSGASILGVVVQDQLTINGEVLYQDVIGEVLEIDVKRDASKQTFSATDLGVSYDIVQVGTEMFIDPDDTSGPLLQVVGYDNYRRVAFVTIPLKYLATGYTA